MFSKVAEYVPTYLISSSNYLTKEIHLTDYTQSLAVTCCSIVISIVAGWLVFNKKKSKICYFLKKIEFNQAVKKKSFTG
ncbi:hypothetical protein NWO25_00105 [Enterococcus lactis]|nr:hypothetical protein [Enterococcus lactis]